MNTVKDLDSQIKNMHRIGISGHVRPDGDCVGSTLAVYNYIRDNYPDKEVEVFLQPLPRIFLFLQNSDKVISDYPQREKFDLFIALDCGDASRMGDAEGYFKNAAHTLCVDHHESNQPFADDNYIFPDASSTCELVYELMDKDKLTKAIAECLYTGIVHDTGVFQYSCTSSKTMNVAGHLMDLGIDYSMIIDKTFYEKTYNQNRVLGYAVEKSRLYLDGQCIVSSLTTEEMDKYQVVTKHMEGIVNQLRVTKGVRVAVFMYQNPDGTYKVSMRATDDTNLAEVAVHFGGGGHAKAAGFDIAGEIGQNTEVIVEELARRWNKNV